MARRRAPLALGIWLVVATPFAATAFQNERAEFAHLRLGQSVKQMRRSYPAARQLGEESLGATPVFSPFIERYQIRPVRVAGLSRPVSFELRFWKQKLWIIIVYFGDNAWGDVTSYLKGRYGPPATAGAAWMGTTTGVTMSAQQKWFAINDQAMSAEIRAVLFDALKGTKMAQPEIAPTAAPTPAPAVSQ